eukprot:14256108-Ditylum_brightwellii.AAC.1
MEKSKVSIFECPVPYISALAAVPIGCDVLVGGLEGIGVKKVWEAYIALKKDNEEGLLARFKRFLCEQGNMEEEVLVTYTKAFLCEPANVVDINNTKYIYIFSPPTIPTNYLREFGERTIDEEFASDSNEKVQITDGQEMLTCAGPGNGDYVFLKAEKYFTCASFHVCICKNL